MNRIFAGRYAAHTDEPFVVFLVGMRINQFTAVRQWLPVARAMQPMLETLYRHPEKGFLGGELILYWRGIGVIQYWRSLDDLHHFATNPADPHLPAWKAFNQATGSNGVVGIWHETYQIHADEYTCIYGNMPAFGLAKATEHVTAHGSHARKRWQASPAQPVAVPSDV